MPLPTTKEELLDKLHTAHSRLDAELEEMENKVARKKSAEFGLSPCDLIAYQIGWGKLLLGWESSEKKGKTPEMPAKGFKWNQLGDLAATFYREYADLTLDELRKELRRTVDKIAKMIAGLTTAQLFELKQRKWAGPKWPLVKWIQVNTIAPYTSATAKIRKIKKTKSSRS